MRHPYIRYRRKLWYEFLAGLPYRFTRQKPLVEYIVDFCCAQLLLAVEVDVDTHFSDGARRYDAARTAALHARGIRVLRFTNEDVMQRFEGVCSAILKAFD